MKLCTSCGSTNDPDARFCAECGVALPAAEPPAAPHHDAADEQPAAAAPRRRVLRTVAGVVAAVLLVAGGSYLGLDVLRGRGSGGASSATAAVEGLGTAVSDRDPLTLLSMIAPAQVRSFADTYTTARDKSEDAGLIGDNPFSGVDLSVKGLELAETSLGDDVAAVSVKGGTLGYTVRPAELAPGFRGSSEDEPRTGEVSLAGLDEEAVGFDAPIITVKQDGRWYVSPAHTALEWWRRAHNYPAADYSAGPSDTTGAESPEEVVRSLTRAVSAVDVQGLLDLASPDELAAVYHYRNAIMTGLQENGVVEQLRSEGTLTFDDVRTVVKDEDGDSARVVVTSLSGGASTPGGDASRFTFEDGCLRITAGEDSEALCGGDLTSGLGYSEDVAGAVAELSIAVVKVDGRWYLSPVRTVADAMQRAVDGMDSKDLLDAVDAPQLAPAEKALTAEPVSGSFDEGGDYDVYELDVPADSLYRVCLEGEEVTSDAYEPDGKTSDGLGNGVYRSSAAGKHKVLVSSYEPGDYRVAAVVLAPKPARVGSTISGPAAAAGSCSADAYTIALTAGTPLLVEGAGRIDVVDPDGSTFDDASVVIPYTTGEHLVLPAAGEAYSKQLKALPAGTLTTGSSKSGTVSGTPATYSLFVAAGTRATVAVTSSDGSLDATLAILSPTGQELASADDTVGKDPSITYTFTASGTYRLRVAGYNGTTGPFVLTVSS